MLFRSIRDFAWLVAIAVSAGFIVSGSASAAKPLKIPLNIVVEPWEFACDGFTVTVYEELNGTSTIFFDGEGNISHQSAHVNWTFTYTNLQTDVSFFSENIVNIDAVPMLPPGFTNEYTVRGTDWKLRDEAGELISIRAGRATVNFDNGEISLTPHGDCPGIVPENICPVFLGLPPQFTTDCN